MGEKRYLTEIQVAEMLNLALSTLRNDRAQKRRIPYTKFGSAVRYDYDDVVAVMESNKIKGYSDNEIF
jgi:hypothetical protein